jgi:hypothetical protein
MSKYLVELEFIVPHYTVIEVEAQCPEDACVKVERQLTNVAERDEFSFQIEEVDYASASTWYVSSVWEGKFYSGTNVIPEEVRARSEALRSQYARSGIAGHGEIATQKPLALA